MKNASKSKASLWFGHLNAGARSSPVLRDARLDTGNPKTLYMFNLKRGEILEYAREVVEQKLRELKPAESEFIGKLDAGYKKARRNFNSHTAIIRNITKRPTTVFKDKTENFDDSEILIDNADLLMDVEEA